MPRGNDTNQPDQPKRQATHVERNERDPGKDTPTAERVAWNAKREKGKDISHESQRHGDRH